MKICSVCQRCYEDAAAVCIEDHGTLIAGRAGNREMISNYRLDSLLGRDAVGESYAATNIALDQPFVIKIIARNFIGETEKRVFQREVQAAAVLDHPHLVRVYQSDSLDDGDFYIIRESVGGRTLQENLRDVGSLSEAEAVTVARQTAEALIAAHSAGIIHRAVSPANIIFTNDPQDKVSVKLQNFDFGGIRQRAITENLDADAPINILRYFSPEQFDGKSVNGETDVYSLGVVLYEMLCGRSPFDAPTSAAIADRQINEQPLAQLRFDTRALLTHILKGALQNNPAARLPTASLARQLRHIEQISFLPPQNQVESKPISAPDRAESAATTDTTNADEETYSFGTLTPILIEKNEIKTESAALIPVESPATNINLNNLNRTFAAEKPTDEIPFESGIGQNAPNVPDKSVGFGKLEPVFIAENEVGANLPERLSTTAENDPANIVSFEPSPVISAQNRSSAPLLEPDLRQSALNVPDEQFPLGKLEPVFITDDVADKLPAAPPAAPVADAYEVRKAESAAPNFSGYPNEIRPPRRTLPANRSAFIGAGLLMLLIAVIAGAFFYNRQQNSAVSATPTAAPPVSADQPSATEGTNKAVETAEKPQIAPPLTAQNAPLVAAQETLPTDQAASEQTKTISDQTTNAVPQKQLNSALDDWISATNARDVNRQMNYYAPRLNAYYLTRNTPQTAVRAEKNRVFDRADAVDIEAGKPDITLSPDGQKATMRFRKKYAVQQGPQTRKGEVLQELQWVKSDDGWKIVSERDIKVISR